MFMRPTRPQRHQLPILAAVLWLLPIATLVPAVAWASGTAGAPSAVGGHAPATPEALAPDIEQYRQHITTLSNPFFEGRAPGTTGNRLAADYIEFNYRNLNLTPAFPSEATQPSGIVETVERTSYRQPFTAPPSARPGDSVKLRSQEVGYAAAGQTTTLVADQDFKALGYSGTGDVTGSLAFAGYAINSVTNEYETFTDETDLTGKVVMLMRFEPMDEDGHSLWVENRDMAWSFSAALEPKLRLAADHKAAGIILVSPPGADDERTGKLEGLDLGGRQFKVPIVMMSIEAADALVRTADTEGRTLMDLRRIADAGGGIIDLPKAQATLTISLERVPLLTDNVGAILPGRGDLADEFIVIGSHYDHVGYGYFGSRDRDARGKIHAGADDNASGTSGNLLIARRLTEVYAGLPEETPARSILFLAFSAEESGLVGSKFYVKNPIVPIEQHYLMLNMDMIGRLREGRIEVGGVGSADGLTEWTTPYWDSSGMKVKTMKRGPSNSDHASFYGVKVPVLFFFTGMHPEYHTSKDVVSTINFEGGAQVADLVCRIAIDAALRPETFPFSDGSDGSGDKASEPADPHAAPQAAGPVGGTGVRFGIAPGDYSGETPGVLIGEVMEGLPAAKAGLKAGDLMMKWNGSELRDVEAWMPLLQAAKPGDKVVITFIRDKETHTTEVTLVARSRPNQ